MITKKMVEEIVAIDTQAVIEHKKYFHELTKRQKTKLLKEMNVTKDTREWLHEVGHYN
jgi:hypothetical protein